MHRRLTVADFPAVAPSPGGAERPDLLAAIDLPRDAAAVVLVSGRRLEAVAGDDGVDRLTVRAATGEVVLRVALTSSGPVLSFEGASVELAATRTLVLAAEEVHLRAGGDLVVEARGDYRERVRGTAHRDVGGALRCEVGTFELAAGSVGVRTDGPIALDGSEIDLNGDPCPRPFAWSRAAAGGRS